jgi:WD40 repeat protein
LLYLHFTHGGEAIVAPNGSIALRSAQQIPAASPDLTLWAERQGDRGIVVHQGTSGDVVAEVSLEALPQGPPWPGNEARPDQIALHPQGHLLAATNGSGTVVVWDLRSGDVVTTIAGSSADQLSPDIQGLAFSPDGTRLVVKSPSNVVRLFRVGTTGTWQVLGSQQIPFGVTAGKPFFSSDGQFVAVDGGRVYDGRTLEPIIEMSTGPGTRFTTDGRALVGITGMPFEDRPDPRLVLRLSLATDDLLTQACGLANRDLTDDEWLRYMGPDTPRRSTCS